MTTEEASTKQGSMKASLGLVSATTLIVGSAIGSGIFALPSVMAGQVPAPGLLLTVWILGGVFSLFGALTYAEMGAMFPRAGGQYVFLREAFGDRVAFSYGWTFFWVINTGIIAAVAYVFAEYVGVLFAAWGWATFTDFDVKMVAVGCILALSGVNYLGVKYGGAVQNVFTIAKVAAIFALVATVFLLSPGSGEVVTPFLPGGMAGTALAGGIAAALVAALFAYDGWASSAAIASEVRDPQRTVPLSMLLGVLIVMAVYLSAVAAYLYAFTIPEVQATETLASDIMFGLFGATGAILIAAAIVVSTFGTVNAYVLSGPRTYYAQAKEGLSYPGFGSLSERFGTPDFGLLIQAEWACLLVLTGGYQSLVNYATLGIILFYAIGAIGFFRLRRTHAHVPRPYKAFGYPVVPALFVLGALFIIGTVVVTDQVTGFANTWPAIVIIAASYPVYELLRYLERRKAARGPPAQAAPVPVPVAMPGDAPREALESPPRNH